jgi:Transglutaminase-like superfamily
MKKVVLVLLAFLFSFKNTPLEAQSVAELTQQITAGRATDSAKITAIYDWLTDNITYDHAHKRQREGDTVLRQEPYNVIAFKKAVCMGYAKTLRDMCRLSGIDAHLVEGWGKSHNNALDGEGHAWNVVKINNNWYQLDATWDAGSAISQKKYFLTPPSVFNQNHLPRDPMWQLSTAPMSIQCFTNGADCPEPSAPTRAFNFSDTIRLWQSLDTAQRLYNQALRTLQFNPSDAIALRELADYYTHNAEKLIEQYQGIRKAMVNKKRPANDKNAVLKLLETTVNYLQSAQLIYQTLITKNRKGTYTDAHFNNESITQLLEQLEAEKIFVESSVKK